MKKTHLCTILILLMICLLCSCNKNTKKDKKSNTNVENSSGVLLDHTDFSEVRDDLSKLEEDEITGICLHSGTGEYSTTDKEIIRQIKEQLMTVELEEANFDDVFSSVETMWIGDGYQIYLCSYDKVYYKLRLINSAVFCGHGQYRAISGEGLAEVINIAKHTFWRD